MTLEELLTCAQAAGVSMQARLVVENSYGEPVLIRLVDVERGDFTFLRFFRDDDIPAFLGAPGSNVPAETIDCASTLEEAKSHATARISYPWSLPCRMSIHGDWHWHNLEFGYVTNIEGYETIVLVDAGTATEMVNMLW